MAVLATCLFGGCVTESRVGVGGASAEPAAAPTARASVDPVATVEASATVLSPKAEAPERTVEESGGFKLAQLSSAECTADGPADWLMQATDKSDRADIISPDGSMYAGYGIQAVNTTLQGYASAYPPPLDDPGLYSEDTATVAEAYSRIVVSAMGGAPDLAATQIVEATPGYLLMAAAGSTHSGVAFFRANGYPGDGMSYSYVLPMYFAFATTDRWDREGALVARVAASIRCRTQFQPPDDYPIVEGNPTGGNDDPNGDDAGYNPQLGTEAVNDPNTGENYIVDPSVNWSETGPDGAGYYVQKGVDDYQKLVPGRVD